MNCGERVKEIRKTKGMTLEKFGERVGVTKQTVSRIENGVNALTEQMLISICREFNVNEGWLRNGDGEMFVPLPEEDEVAAYVSQLLDPDNDFLDLIVEIMRTYSQLDPKSQEVLLEFSRKLKENIKKED